MKNSSILNSRREAVANVVALVIASALFVSTAGAAQIDFETINGAIPVEGMAVSNQFAPQFGVVFRSGNPSKAQPAIARKGAPVMAFSGGIGGAGHDTLSTNEPLAASFGDYFLSDDNVFDGDNKDLVIEFTGPVSQAGGYLFDIDGGDVVKLIAWADTNATIEVDRLHLTTNSPGTGNGLATAWSLRSGNKSRVIRRIDVKMNDGAGNANVGFDNFWSDYEPLPVTPPNVSLKLVAGVTIEGEVGRLYRVEYSSVLDMETWLPLTNIFLPSSPYLFIDPRPLQSGQRFFRAVGLP